MKEKLITTIRSLISLSQEDAQAVNELFKCREIKKGDFFLQEGQVCRHAAFVATGLMRYYINHEGEEKTYEFGQEGNFVCNYESFLPRVPSTKVIQALEDCQLYQISHNDLQVFYQTVEGAERFGRLVIEQVFLQLLNALSSLYTDIPEVRYKRLLTEHPDLLQRVSQYHIASYVGVKPQSLSRIRKRIFAGK